MDDVSGCVLCVVLLEQFKASYPVQVVHQKYESIRFVRLKVVRHWDLFISGYFDRKDAFQIVHQICHASWLMAKYICFVTKMSGV